MLIIPSPPRFVPNGTDTVWQPFQYGSLAYWQQNRYINELKKNGSYHPAPSTAGLKKAPPPAEPDPLERSACDHPEPSARIFDLGWSKTGTTSFTHLLRLLGFRSMHNLPSRAHAQFEQWVVAQQQKAAASASESTLLATRSLLAAEALADMPYARDDVWPHLERTFPGSLYVLVIREEAEWARSLMHNAHLMLRSPFHNTPHERSTTAHSFNMSLSSFSFAHMYRMLCEGNTEPFLRVYREHNARVRSYFATLPPSRTLVLNTTELAVPNMARLATFLGCKSERVAALQSKYARVHDERHVLDSHANVDSLPSSTYCQYSTE